MLLIPLNDIYFTQEHFRNKDQIRAIAKTIKEGEAVKKIELFVQGGKNFVLIMTSTRGCYYLAGRLIHLFGRIQNDKSA